MFFGMFEKNLQGVLRLRLDLHLPPTENQYTFYTHGMERKLLEPVEGLLKGRDWTGLQLCVPGRWQAFL